MFAQFGAKYFPVHHPLGDLGAGRNGGAGLCPFLKKGNMIYICVFQAASAGMSRIPPFFVWWTVPCRKPGIYRRRSGPAPGPGHRARIPRFLAGRLYEQCWARWAASIFSHTRGSSGQSSPVALAHIQLLNWRERVVAPRRLFLHPGGRLAFGS